jgi:hypothetical protein
LVNCAPKFIAYPETVLMSDSVNKDVDNGCADAIAATAIIGLVVLGAIHFVYTGGLPAFLASTF